MRMGDIGKGIQALKGAADETAIKYAGCVGRKISTASTKHGRILQAL